MKKEFVIDNICYVVEFTEHNHFNLYIDYAKSRKDIYKMSDFDRMFGDEPPETIWEKTDTRYVFRVLKEVKAFIDSAIRRYKPYYFTYSANEEVKASSYRRFAERIAKKYGYSLGIAGKRTFCFYRLS